MASVEDCINRVFAQKSAAFRENLVYDLKELGIEDEVDLQVFTIDTLREDAHVSTFVARKLDNEGLLKQVGLETLWEVLSAEIPGEVVSSRISKRQRIPAGGGRTAEVVQRWDLLPEATTWLESQKDKLSHHKVVRGTFRTNIYSNTNPIARESQVYSSIKETLFEAVNVAAKALGIHARLTDSVGKVDCPSKSLVDLMGERYDPDTLKATHVILPIEAKGEWQEFHEGANFHTLLLGPWEEKKRVVKPAAQLLMYSVVEGCRYSVLISNRHLVCSRRSLDAFYKSVDYSDTFDINMKNPEARKVLLYMLAAANEAISLDPRCWINTCPARKWIIKVRHALRVPSIEAIDYDIGPDVGGGGSDDSSSHHGRAESSDASHSRGDRKRRTRPSSRGSSDKTTLEKRKCSTSKSTWTLLDGSLSDCPFGSLDLGDVISHSENHLVRMGKWEEQAAIYKIWDVSKRPEGYAELWRELQVYQHLAALQGHEVVRALGAGQLFGGMMIFLAMENVGLPLDSCNPDILPLALQTIRKVHSKGILHQDLCVRQFVCQGQRVALLDFSTAVFAPKARKLMAAEYWLLEKELLSLGMAPQTSLAELDDHSYTDISTREGATKNVVVQLNYDM